MDRNLVFCEECRTDVDYTITELAMTGAIKGEKYRYVGQEAQCIACGSRVYVPGVNDYNLKALYDVYRQRNGIVSRETIRAIPERYAIGKRPLSLLLGWGEQTFSRYCEGDMPTKQYSEILTRIYDDPAYYAGLLEAGKGRLKSAASYEKSKKAVDALLGMADGEASKISMVVKYLLNQCEDITPLPPRLRPGSVSKLLMRRLHSERYYPNGAALKYGRKAFDGLAKAG